MDPVLSSPSPVYRPATTITWTRNSVTVTEGTETVLENPVIAQYIHTLTVKDVAIDSMTRAVEEICQCGFSQEAFQDIDATAGFQCFAESPTTVTFHAVIMDIGGVVGGVFILLLALVALVIFVKNCQKKSTYKLNMHKEDIDIYE